MSERHVHEHLGYSFCPACLREAIVREAAKLEAAESSLAEARAEAERLSSQVATLEKEASILRAPAGLDGHRRLVAAVDHLVAPDEVLTSDQGESVKHALKAYFDAAYHDGIRAGLAQNATLTAERDEALEALRDAIMAVSTGRLGHGIGGEIRVAHVTLDRLKRWESAISGQAPSQALSERAPLPTVGGEFMERSIGDFVRACQRHIEDEQQGAMPDNALIATLCDAVRLTRELERVVKAPSEARAEAEAKCFRPGRCKQPRNHNGPCDDWIAEAKAETCPNCFGARVEPGRDGEPAFCPRCEPTTRACKRLPCVICQREVCTSELGECPERHEDNNEGCELSNGRGWVCSGLCWEKATRGESPSTPAPAAPEESK